MKEKILSILFVGFLSMFFILNVIIPDVKISRSERRKLQQIPKFSFSEFINGDFTEEFDLYTVDQFIFRDYFRSIKANVNYNIFKKLDNNGIYLVDNIIFKKEYPTNIKSINNFIKKINSVEKYLTENNKVYYSIIPDKNYYLNSNNYLNIDYDLLYTKIKDINYEYIELRDILSLNDYYKTDTHWKQENLCKVVNRIGESLNFSTMCNYTKKVYNNFFGVYYGQAALKLEPDVLTYLISDNILNSEVYYYENKEADRKRHCGSHLESPAVPARGLEDGQHIVEPVVGDQHHEEEVEYVGKRNGIDRLRQMTRDNGAPENIRNEISDERSECVIEFDLLFLSVHTEQIVCEHDSKDDRACQICLCI